MTRMVDISSTRIMFGAGKLDTDKRYIRAATSGATFPIPRGRTIFITAGSAAHYASWRYSDGVNSKTDTSSNATATGDPSYTLVRL